MAGGSSGSKETSIRGGAGAPATGGAPAVRQGFWLSLAFGGAAPASPASLLLLGLLLLGAAPVRPAACCGLGLGDAAAGALVPGAGPVRADDLLVRCVVELAHQVTVTFEMPVASMTSCAK